LENLAPPHPFSDPDCPYLKLSSPSCPVTSWHLSFKKGPVLLFVASAEFFFFFLFFSVFSTTKPHLRCLSDIPCLFPTSSTTSLLLRVSCFFSAYSHLFSPGPHHVQVAELGDYVSNKGSPFVNANRGFPLILDPFSFLLLNFWCWCRFCRGFSYGGTPPQQILLVINPSAGGFPLRLLSEDLRRHLESFSCSVLFSA